MKKLILFVLSCVLLPAAQLWAQTSLTLTTLSGAVNGTFQNSGVNQLQQTQVTLASLTNVTALQSGFTTAYKTVLFVDREQMAVQTVNTTNNTVTVLRGYNGTFTSAHANGQLVYVGSPDQFFNFDPAGACTTAQTKVTPWININTGNQWTCNGTNWILSGGPYLSNLLITAIPSSDTISAAGSFATTLPIPAVNLNVGSVLTIRAHGIYTTTATASPQAAFQVNAGGTSGQCPAPSAITLGTGTASASWELVCYVQINTQGNPGTAAAWGDYEFANNVNGAEVIGNNRLFPTPTALNYITTSPQTLSLQETATLVSGQTFTLQSLTVEEKF